MKALRNIDVPELSRKHSEEIRSMVAGIDAPAESQVWTATMRASVRGGKPLGFNQVEEVDGNS